MKKEPALGLDEAKVFQQLRIRKAMPELEIGGLPGIYGDRLKGVISRLSDQRLITIRPHTSALDRIGSISGKYF